MAPIGTSSSYAHLKFQALIPSLITLGFWLQWAPSNFFKLYTLEAFSLRHNETLSSFQDLSKMVKSKFVVLQMIPHTLFIEWDFGHCLPAGLLFTELFTSRFTVHGTVH